MKVLKIQKIMKALSTSYHETIQDITMSYKPSLPALGSLYR